MAAGPRAILYGVEIIGVSDTVLHTIRARFATAASTSAGGKSPDITLWMLDGPGGTLDPAFMAHAEPMKLWVTAWWERWFAPEMMHQAFAEASIKPAASDRSWWGRTAGPVAALVATMNRLGWTIPSAKEIIDNNGHSWLRS
jgi:hypothetical protein